MRVLIVEQDPALAEVWGRHLRRQGADVRVASSENAAVEALRDRDADVIVLNLLLREGSALSVADYASYRRPAARVIFVTGSSFFSDGSIFRHISNAAACVPTATRPEDLAALVDHHGMAQ